ncbi:MAG: RNA-binding protein [Deltaproteobacteria bacterium]|nr:RNA-binding protein [Deltaproteobacteria bacterium]
MPKGPQGQKRPADVIGAAIKVAKIATGEIAEEADGKEYARKGGKKGGQSRATKLSAKRRKEIAEKAARARWSK